MTTATRTQAAPKKRAEATLQQYATLLEVSKSIVSHKNLAELFHDLSERLKGLVNFHFFALVLYDAARNVMRMHVLETTKAPTVRPGDEFGMDESPSAVAWSTQQPFIIEDTHNDERFPRVMQLLREQNVRCFCSLPLTSAHRRLGTMNFGSDEAGAFTPDDLEFPQLIAAQLALAVDNALNFEEAQSLQHQLARDSDRLQLLLDLNNRVVSSLDFRELFRAISSGIRRVMECDYAGLSLPDPEKQETMRVYALDFPEGKGLLHEEMQVPFEGAASAKAYSSFVEKSSTCCLRIYASVSTIKSACCCYSPQFTRDICRAASVPRNGSESAIAQVVGGSRMEFTAIAGRDIQVSRIALGTWALGGKMWGGSDEDDSIRMIHAAIERGINLIDTAPVYGFGLSERGRLTSEL
jgi:GAF domain-containing protein